MNQEQKDVREEIKKLPSSPLRILLMFGGIVISTLFGMWLTSNNSSIKEKNETIKEKNETIRERDKIISFLNGELKNCNDARFADKEAEYQRTLRKQEKADSIKEINESTQKKIDLLNKK